MKEIIDFAKQWFIKNPHVTIPSTAKEWQDRRVRDGNTPPGLTTGSLRRKGLTAKWLIDALNGVQEPILRKNKGIDYESVGFILLSKKVSENGHSRCTVQCAQCEAIDTLDYGTLSRMAGKGSMYCMVCRAAGGKPKPIETYSKEDFTAIEKVDGRIVYRHTVCGNTISRVPSAAIPICEHCNPREGYGARTTVNGISFPSKLEGEVYLVLQNLTERLGFSLERQVPYNKIFCTGTKHTADFYIPEIHLVIEASNMNTNSTSSVTARYKQTKEWKMSLDDNVLFVSCADQVEDIVRRYMKV